MKESRAHTWKNTANKTIPVAASVACPWSFPILVHTVLYFAIKWTSDLFFCISWLRTKFPLFSSIAKCIFLSLVQKHGEINNRGKTTWCMTNYTASMYKPGIARANTDLGIRTNCCHGNNHSTVNITCSFVRYTKARNTECFLLLFTAPNACNWSCRN